MGLTLGNVAVDLFFVTSGFLVVASLINRNNFIEFAWARFLRIFPALIVMLLITVFGVGMVFSSLPASEYLKDTGTYYYLARCASLFAGALYELPGVFTDNPIGNAVNGSLWTLPHEVRFYALLAFAWIALKAISSSHNNAFAKTTIVAYVALAAFQVHAVLTGYEPNKGVTLLFMFMSGCMYYVFRDKISISNRLALVVAALLMLSLVEIKLFKIAYLFALPYLLFCLAYGPAGIIRNYNSLGDYSYGVYIYAYPVQQSIAALFPGVGVISMIVFSTIITLILSVLSWHFVERRALLLKGHSRVIERYAREKVSTIFRQISRE